MSVSLYCSTTHFKLVTGSADSRAVKITDFGELPLPDGAMINGIITDADIMTRYLSNVNDNFGLGKEAAYLVIDSNNILSKTMDVPPVSEQKILDFIQQDMTQYQDESSDTVYDYTVLNPKAESGGATILAIGVARTMLENYRTVLLSAGFNLKGINTGTNCQIKLAKFVPQLSGGTLILAQIDDRILSLTLFEDGQYMIGNKYRLMNQENTPQWFSEIGNNLSSMIQFNKGQHASGQISAAYFAGLSEIQFPTLTENLRYLNIDINLLNIHSSINLTGKAASKEGFDPNRLLLNIGNLLKV